MHDQTRLIQSAELVEGVKNRSKAHHQIEEAIHTILLNVGENPDQAGPRKA